MESTSQFQSQVQAMWAQTADDVIRAMERTRNLLRRVELLAELGWTLPMTMSLPEVQSLLMQEPLTPEQLRNGFFIIARTKKNSAL